MGSDGSPAVQPVNLLEMATVASGRIGWSQETADLNVNLLILQDQEQVEPHRNNEVDVLTVGVQGKGTIVVDGEEIVIETGSAVIIPKGTERAIRPRSSPFAYLTCHRRRLGLWPAEGHSRRPQ